MMQGSQIHKEVSYTSATLRSEESSVEEDPIGKIIETEMRTVSSSS